MTRDTIEGETPSRLATTDSGCRKTAINSCSARKFITRIAH